MIRRTHLTGTPRSWLATRIRSGMTMFEVIVALVITSMIAVTAALTFSMIIKSDQVLKGSTTQIERAAAVRDLIRQWITTGTITPDSGGIPGQTSIGGSSRGGGRGGATAVTTASTPGDSTGVTTAQGDGDELRFTTSAVTPAEAPNVLMRLFICDDPNALEHGLSLEYQTVSTAPLMRIQLDSSIGNITVYYLDSQTSMWFPAAQVGTIKPVAIKFSLGPIDSTVVADSISDLLYMPFIFRMGDPQASLTTSTSTGGRGGGGGGGGGRGGGGE